MAGAAMEKGSGTSVFDNPSAMVFLDRPRLETGYFQRYGLQELSSSYFTFQWVLPKLSLGAGMRRLGDDHYNHSILSAGVANKFGLASLGLSVELHQVNIQGFGTRHFPVLVVSGTAELSHHFLVSGVAYNLTQAKISEANELYHPTLMSAGFSYTSNEGLWVSMQMEKDLRYPMSIMCGIEYSLESIAFRTGLHSSPMWYTFGTRLSKGRFQFDYAIRLQTGLPNSHAISANIQFKK